MFAFVFSITVKESHRERLIGSHCRYHSLNFEVPLNNSIFVSQGDGKVPAAVASYVFHNPCVWIEARKAWGAGDSSSKSHLSRQKGDIWWSRFLKGTRMDNSRKQGKRGQAINKQIKTRQERWIRSDPITSPGLIASGSRGDFTVICFKLLIFSERFPSSRLEGMNKWMLSQMAAPAMFYTWVGTHGVLPSWFGISSVAGWQNYRILFFNFLQFYWSIVDLQCWFNFC